MAGGSAVNSGIQGSDGKTILNGTGAPGAGLGTDGDFYIDTAALEIYGPKTAGVWGSGTSIVGTDGVGIPVGGTADQILTKIDGTDYNVQWSDPPASGIALIHLNNEYQQFSQNWYTWTNLDGGYNKELANLNLGSAATPVFGSPTHRRGGIFLPAGTIIKRIDMVINSTSGAGKEVCVLVGSGNIPTAGSSVSNAGPDVILLNDPSAFSGITANNFQKYGASLGDYVLTEDNYLHVIVRGDGTAPASVLRNYTSTIIQVILP